MTCCGAGPTPTQCNTRTVRVQWSNPCYSAFGGACGNYLRQHIEWELVSDPTYTGTRTQQRPSPPAYQETVVSTGPDIPLHWQPFTSISKTPTYHEYLATITSGQPVSGLLRIKITLSNPVTRQDIVNTLRYGLSTFDLNLLATQDRSWAIEFRPDGSPIPATTGVRLPVVGCLGGFGPPIPAGLVVSAYRRDTEFFTGRFQGVFGPYGSIMAWLAVGRLERELPFCTYYTPLPNQTSCDLISRPYTPDSPVLSCGPIVKTYFPQAGIIPLIGEQEDSPYPDYAIIAPCPGFALPAPFPACGP